MFGYKLATALFLAFFLRGCDGKIVVDHVPSPVTPGSEVPANGVMYALPNTVIRIQVKLDKTERSGARFATYAAIFAPGMTPVCKDGECTKEGKTTYSLQDGTTFSTYGEPDPQNVYLVRFMGKGAIDQTFSMNWNELGILSSASATVTNRTGDIVVSALKVAAGLGTKAAFGSSVVAGQPPPCKYDHSATDDDIIPVLRKDLSVYNIFETNYCSLPKEARDELPHGPNDLKLLEGAVDAYIDRVKTLVLLREKILEGKSTFQEPTSLLSHIESEINEQLKFLYVGSKGTLTWDGVLDIKNVVEGSPLTVMRIDKTGGICLDPAVIIQPSTKPIPGKFTQLVDAACSAARPINLTLKYYPDKDKQLFTKIKDVTEGDRSFRYRVAAQVQAVLSDADSAYGSGLFSVAQLGKVISLPASRHSKTITYELSFIESTGALKTFKLGTVGGLDAATVDALGGVGGTLLDARKTEAETLTLQLQLLKLKDDICTIQKKYNLPCTVEPQ
jgi:hypothetical protein